MKEDSLALEMLKELKHNSKRWFIAFLVTLILWFATIGVFVWYINQSIDEIEETTYTQDADNLGENSEINQNIGE